MQGVIAIPPSSSVTAPIAVSTTLTFVMATTTVVASTTLTKITAVYCSTVLCCYTSSVSLSPLDICSYSEYECSNGYRNPRDVMAITIAGTTLMNTAALQVNNPH